MWGTHPRGDPGGPCLASQKGLGELTSLGQIIQIMGQIIPILEQINPILG